jgi:uncharacterized membrane protein
MMRKIAVALAFILLPSLMLSSAPVIEAALIVFPDGWVDVTLSVSGVSSRYYDLRIVGDPQNLIVTSSGLILNYSRIGGIIRVDTLGLPQFEVNYQTQSLTSKIGIIWNLTLSLPSSSTKVYLPADATIVGISSLPDEISSEGEWIKLSFGTGTLWVSYKLEKISTPLTVTRSQARTEVRTATSVTESKGNESSRVKASTESTTSESKTSVPSKSSENAPFWYIYILVPIIVGVSALLLIRSRARKVEYGEIEELIMRELRARGGEMTQSDLTKALGLPRATVWRRIRKMEMEGILTLERRGNITVVRLRR